MPNQSNFEVKDLPSLTEYLIMNNMEKTVFEHAMFLCATSSNMDITTDNLITLIRTLLARPFPSQQSERLIEENVFQIPQDIILYWTGQKPHGDNTQITESRNQIIRVSQYIISNPNDVIIAAYAHDILFQGGRISDLTSTVGYMKLLENQIGPSQKPMALEAIKIASQAIKGAVEQYGNLTKIVDDSEYLQAIKTNEKLTFDGKQQAFYNYIGSTGYIIKSIYSSLQAIDRLVDRCKDIVESDQQVKNQTDVDGLNPIDHIENEMKRILVYSRIYTKRCFTFREMMKKKENWQNYARETFTSHLFKSQYQDITELKSLAHDKKVPDTS